MLTFKCKVCGGELEIQNGSTVVQCEYCGTKQTLPRLDDEKRANLYDRANHLRRNNEFDKASAIYEQILAEDNADAEAYWSLILCRYGIEYVEDPLSRKRVPTVHRTQYTSIFDDDNYKQAIKNADSYQRIIYEEEAKAINEIQKGILAISQKEDPFDVFICYKEIDDSGKRTNDSVLAQDLYYQLKQEGFKVFFARITLEDKLGSAYEPYIFAALNSAKVMVALGTKPEYFNAVWVKNEWSRFLSLIKNGEKKMLIPAYKDMDPYDLPAEFSHLQAQDMSKLGFMQDLIRGIKKILGQDKKPETPAVERVIVQENGSSQGTASFLRRAFLFLEDGDFDNANEYAEKVLDIDPECAEAYIVKLLVELKLKTPSDLKQYREPISDFHNYEKAIRFASPEYKETLEGYNNAIIKRIYDRGVELMELRRYDEAVNFFRRIFNYNDSIVKIAECTHLMNDGIYNKAMDHLNAKKYDEAIEFFQTITDYKDSAKKIDECKNLKETERLEGIYDKAMDCLYAKKYDEAERIFQTIRNYKDSAKKIDECKNLKETERLEGIYDKAMDRLYAKKYDEAERIFQTIKNYKDSRTKINFCNGKIRAKKIKKFLICAIISSVILIAAIVMPKIIKLQRRNNYINNGEYGKIIRMDDLTEYIIPDGVTEIGEEEFLNCSSLISITIPNSVTSIGSDAFSGCSSLISITIPNSVTSIGSDAFSGCSSLISITIPNNVISIGAGSFRECSSLSSITIGESVTTIGESAFYGCTSLTSIIIPNSVTTIGESAFAGCGGLESITLPFVGNSAIKTTESYKTVFGYIFGRSSYSGGVSVRQYYSLSSSDRFTYYIPRSLKSVTITGGNMLYGAFYGCSSLTNIIIGDGVTSIGDWAFCDCSSITSIKIPDSVTSIGLCAFYDCSSLTSVTISNSVTCIENSTFSGCTSLKSIEIPNNVTSIESSAFSWCTSLTSITIPNSVTSIGNWAFRGCDSLVSVTFENPNGWYVSNNSDGTSSRNLTLTDAAQNATYLATYYNWYWKRK